jgi:hypothetical protein
MKIKLVDLLGMNREYVPEIVYHELLKLIDGLEKRIASLESKPQETDSDRHPIDFKCEEYTKVPTGENEINTERLKGENTELKNEVLALRKQLIAEGLL